MNQRPQQTTASTFFSLIAIAWLFNVYFSEKNLWSVVSETTPSNLCLLHQDSPVSFVNIQENPNVAFFINCAGFLE